MEDENPEGLGPMIASEAEIKRAYGEEATARGYIAERFASELHRLLHDRQVAAVQAALDRYRPERTLELAPGPGRLTRHLRPTGRLVCVEFNAAMIAEGRAATGTSVAWVRGDGFRVPLAPGFDLGYSFRFIRHFERGDRERLYGEIRRLLRPDGVFLMDAVNVRFAGPLRAERAGVYPIYDVLYRRDELFDELAGAGLEPISAEPVQKFYRAQHRAQVVIGPRSGWLNRLLIRGLERLPRREGLEWIVTCRRV